MGQAAVDLTNPADRTDPAAHSTSADDLLAQLAGEEIDRLLAQTDTKSAEAELPGLEALEGGEGIGELESLLSGGIAGSTESAGEAAAAESSADGSPVAQLDDVLAAATAQSLGQISESNVASATVPAVDPQPATPAAAAGESATSPAINFGPAQQQTTADIPTAAPARALEAVADLSKDSDSAARTSLLVRLLELINFPLARCPDVVRDTLGKIAILTALNSVGVLLYVLLFRRH